MITMEPPGETGDSTAMWKRWGLSHAGLSRYLRVAQGAVGLRGEVSVLLAGDAALQRLNRGFRGKNKATDVLSFPAPVEMAAVTAGDLAISLETAARQAREQGHSLRDEVRILLLHGLLHLAGFDHETDKGEMAARETELRGRLRLKSGLIARAGAGSRFLAALGMESKKSKSNDKSKSLNAKGAKFKREVRGVKRGRVGVGV